MLLMSLSAAYKQTSRTLMLLKLQPWTTTVDADADTTAPLLVLVRLAKCTLRSTTLPRSARTTDAEQFTNVRSRMTNGRMPHSCTAGRPGRVPFSPGTNHETRRHRKETM